MSKMTGKTEPIRWRQLEYELLAKYLDNLATEKIYCYFKWFELKHLLMFIPWGIIFTQERAPQQIFTYLKSTIEALKQSVKYVQH